MMCTVDIPTHAPIHQNNNVMFNSQQKLIAYVYVCESLHKYVNIFMCICNCMVENGLKQNRGFLVKYIKRLQYHPKTNHTFTCYMPFYIPEFSIQKSQIVSLCVVIGLTLKLLSLKRCYVREIFSVLSKDLVQHFFGFIRTKMFLVLFIKLAKMFCNQKYDRNLIQMRIELVFEAIKW